MAFLIPEPVLTPVSLGKGDGYEHHQPHQRSAGRHDRGPTPARGPEEEGDAAEGPAGRHLDAGPGQTHQHQPSSAASFHPGENLSSDRTQTTDQPALSRDSGNTSSQNVTYILFYFIFFVDVLPPHSSNFGNENIILFYCK